MSLTNTTPDSTGAPLAPATPTLTEKDAARLGYSKHEYCEAEQYARLTTEEHQRLGTPRGLWEPPALQGEHIAAPFIEDGEQDLNDRLEREADTLLDESADYLEEVKANLDALAETREPLITPESGTAYSVVEAVQVIRALDAKIEQDEAASKHHHRRAPRRLVRWAPWIVWIELFGFLFFTAYFLDVPLLQPWLDFGAWTLSVAIVVATIVGQTSLIHHAAVGHNHGREAAAEGNRREAENAFSRRNGYLIAAASTVTTAITLGMVLRGTTALGNADFATIAFMVFVALVAGGVMPALAFLATALDGSKVSRERDSLAADEDEDLDQYNANVGECQRGIALVAEHRDALNQKVFPDIVNGVQMIVDGAYRPYGLVRLLIGGLIAQPPAQTAPVIQSDESGRVTGHIGTSIPGARSVDIKPLVDRGERLVHLEDQRRALLARVEGLPPHPWGSSHAR